ncbi:hypothetical protein ACEPAI_10106 [Sanghuangporus weigelae]
MLPNELWDLIISNLDKSDAKSMASTSRYYLFEALENLVDPDDNGLDFAHMVRELRVIVARRSLLPDEVFDFLPSVLQRLTKLQRFIWVGEQLSPFVVDELGSFNRYSHFLRAFDIDDVYADVLNLLSNVKSIETIDEWASFSSKHSDSHDVENVLKEIITKHWEGLESLSFNSSCMETLCRGYFDNDLTGITTKLTHFAIENASECFALRTILRQAHVLESLALVDCDSICLPLDEDALPNLRDLKIDIHRIFFCEGSYQEMFSEARTIQEFILLHENIARFDFSQYVSWINDEGSENLEDNATWFSDILDAVCSLENVTALGLTLPALEVSDTEDALLRLTTCDALKKTCKAIRLEGITNVLLDDWTCEFLNCRFIALSDQRPRQRPNTGYAISLQSFICRHRDLHLEQVCLHGRMFDILSTNPDEKVDFKLWSNARASTRTEWDFRSADAYWLMRYRLLSERNEDTRPYRSTEDEDTGAGWTTEDEDEEGLEDATEYGQDDDDDDIEDIIRQLDSEPPLCLCMP